MKYFDLYLMQNILNIFYRINDLSFNIGNKINFQLR